MMLGRYALQSNKVKGGGYGRRAVTRVEAGVLLNLTKEQVGELPPVAWTSRRFR